MKGITLLLPREPQGSGLPRSELETRSQQVDPTSRMRFLDGLSQYDCSRRRAECERVGCIISPALPVYANSWNDIVFQHGTCGLAPGFLRAYISLRLGEVCLAWRLRSAFQRTIVRKAPVAFRTSQRSTELELLGCPSAFGKLLSGFQGYISLRWPPHRRR